MSHMNVAYKSDPGKNKENNEDSILVDVDNGIFLLADGMGGHQAGEVASDIAVKEAGRKLADGIRHADRDNEIAKLLIQGLFQAHEKIQQIAKTDLNLLGMGTTLVAMVIKNEKAHICHVGDSRVYLVREDIRQMTKDQTVGDYLVEHNIMRREEVPPRKWHTLTQAVGLSEHVVPELKQVELKAGDLLLLCSDGLTDMLSHKEIAQIVKKAGADIDKATDILVKRANKKGGKDNISVVLVKYK